MNTLRRYVSDERVLAAIAEVPRDRFVPPDLRAEAWENIPLPIGSGQTISQPLVVARMRAARADGRRYGSRRWDRLDTTPRPGAAGASRVLDRGA